MSKFALLLNGDLTVTERLQAQLADARFIAADGGIRHADTLGVEPETWIGDFDSAGNTLAKRWSHISRQRHPHDKDETDGALAVSAALEAGATQLVLVGCLGGRTDQVLSHLLQLSRLHIRPIDCFGTSGHEEAWPFDAQHPIAATHFAPGTRISIIGLTDLYALSLSGVKWPLKNRNVPCASTLTLSNIVVGDFQLTCERGRAIVFASFPAPAQPPG